MSRYDDEGPYDFAQEIEEARAEVEHLYTPEEIRYGIGAPSRAEVDREEWELDHPGWFR